MTTDFNLPSSMRALVYSEARKFSIVDRALPLVRPHDVLVCAAFLLQECARPLPPADLQTQIKVKACGVCGTDVHIHHGEFGAKVSRLLSSLAFVSSPRH